MWNFVDLLHQLNQNNSFNVICALKSKKKKKKTGILKICIWPKSMIKVALIVIVNFY